jgi:hypothetical protein
MANHLKPLSTMDPCRPQDAGTALLLLLLLQFVFSTQCNCSACDVPPDAELHKKLFFRINRRSGRGSNPDHFGVTQWRELLIHPLRIVRCCCSHVFILACFYPSPCGVIESVRNVEGDKKRGIKT